MTFHTKDEMPDYFKDWNFIRPDTSFDKMMMLEQKLVDGRVQDDDFLNTLLVTNALSLDSNTIMIVDQYKDKEIKLKDETIEAQKKEIKKQKRLKIVGFIGSILLPIITLIAIS